MLVEVALLVLNVSLVVFIVYAIVQPKATQRQVRELIEQACQRWKASRPLRAKTPRDCAACCSQAEARSVARPESVPYRELKSRRGRPKTLDSQGYACLNPGCAYFLETDAAKHALISDGKRGAEHDIQHWRCAACGHTFTARRGTALFRLKSSARLVDIGLHLLCRGMSIQDVAEVIRVDAGTVASWLERGGAHAQRLHAQYATHQRPNVLQLDELLGNVRAVVKRAWVWLAIDPQTKLILSLHVGSRKREAAMTFVHDLAHRLAPGHLPVFLSDGLAAYFHALTAHFGSWQAQPRHHEPVSVVAPDLLYTQVVKVLRWRRLLAALPRALCGNLPEARDRLKALGYSGLAQTAFIERFNLTLRHGITALARRTWATYRSAQRLYWHLELYRSYYHFVRPHASLRLSQQRRTPAMAAGWTTHRWSMAEWLARPVYVA